MSRKVYTLPPEFSFQQMKSEQPVISVGKRIIQVKQPVLLVIIIHDNAGFSHLISHISVLNRFWLSHKYGFLTQIAVSSPTENAVKLGKAHLTFSHLCYVVDFAWDKPIVVH